MATGTIFQLQPKDSVLKINHYDAINAVQSFDWDPSFNEEYFTELGNANYSGQAITPELSGSFEMTATGATVAFLKRMIAKFNATTGEFEGYEAGAPATADNAGLIKGTDLEFAIFDLVEAKKANEEFTRSLILPRCQLSTFSLRADANGSASETYTFEGDMADVFRDPNHDVVALPVTRNSDTEIAVPVGYEVEVAGGPDVASATHIAAYLLIDDVRVEPANLNPNWTTNVFDGTITVSGSTVKSGARLSLVLYKVTAGTFPTIDYPTTARFVRANDIDIYLVAKSTVDLTGMTAAAINAYNFAEADVLLRVQSADINIDLRREPLRQLRKNGQTSAIFYRAATFPLQVTASVSAFETDLVDWQKIQGKSGSDILNLKDFLDKEYQLVLRYFKGNTVLQTTALCDARVSGRGSRVSVGGRSEVTWSFTGSDVRIAGSNG